jgi:ElaB/YqjD/DUF883 family membrane-anchored ribosome-binding protein
MVSRYSNELNSFRSGIEDRVSQHKDKLGAINQALGIKADKVFENAKKISDIGSKLTEGGIGGGVGATALSKYARKGITKFNQFKQDATDRVKGLADKAESKLQEAGSKVEAKAGDLKDAVGNAETQVKQTAQNAQSGAEDAAQSARNSVPSESNMGGANQSVGGTTEEAGGAVKIAPDTEGGDSQPFSRWEQTGKNQGRMVEGDDPDYTTYDEMMKPDAVKYTGDATETKEGDIGDDPSPSSGAGDAGDVEMGTISKTADADPAIESTLGGTAIDLEEDAAATSWLGFLGIPEILAGLGAVAGVAAAGVGIADAVKSGDVNAKAQAMATQAPKTGFQAAGTFVVPTQDSVS